MQNVTMAMSFVLGTMAQQGHVLMFPEVLQKPKGEFLSVVPDVPIATV